ncbi:MAG: FHA domain-containing protein [Planctomycetota bacterium]
MMFVLVVAGGPDKGRVYELTGNDPITLGRGGNLVRLSDRKASRVHARLERDGDAWRLIDNDSRHGTFHNHRRLDGDVTLAAGDVVQLGNTVMVVSLVNSDGRERSELLSFPSMDEPGHGRPWGKLAAAAAVLALVGVAGFQAWDLQQDRAREARIDALLAELDRANPGGSSSTDAALARIESALADQPAALTPMFDALGDRLAKIEAGRARLDALADQLDTADTRLAPAVAALDTLRQQAADTHATMTELAAELATADDTRAKRLDALLARLEAQPTADEIAQRVAQATRQSVVDELRGLPTADAMQEAMRAAATEVGRAQARVLGQSLDRLATPEGLTDRLAAVEQAIADQPTRLEALLAEVRAGGVTPETPAQAELADADLDRLFAEVAAIKAEVDGPVADRLDRVIAALDAQPTVEGLAEAVAAGSPDAAALRRVAERLVAIRNDVQALPTAQQVADELRQTLAVAPGPDPAVLAALVDRLDAIADAEPQAGPIGNALATAEFIDRIDRLEQAVRAQAEMPALITGLDARLARLSETVDASQQAMIDRVAALADASAVAPADDASAPSVEQWADALDELADARAQADARLADRLVALEQSLDALSAEPAPTLDTADQAATLADIAQQQAEAGELLASVLDEVRRRHDLGGVQRQLTDLALLTGSNRERLEQVVVKIDGDQLVDERLARLATRLERWPTESADQFDQVLAAVRAEVGDAEDVEAVVSTALRQELASLRDWLPDRDTLRDDVRMAVAAAAPMVVPTSTDAVANASAATTPIRRVQLRPQQPVLTPSPAAASTAETPLSPTEHAYRVAFQTGQPVTVGAGEIDPVTGAVSPGRRIDPAAARAAGFDTWRQWYASDMFAERMRRQRAATRHLQVDDGKMIRLPGE